MLLPEDILITKPPLKENFWTVFLKTPPSPNPLPAEELSPIEVSLVESAPLLLACHESTLELIPEPKLTKEEDHQSLDFPFDFDEDLFEA